MSVGAGRRVLLVDDAGEVRVLLRAFLEADGFVVVEAVDGESGLAAAKERRPDLVVLDVQLPDVGGPDVLVALQAVPETRDVPVVFLTAAPADGDAALVALGARGVLRKPFRADTVARQLDALL